MFPTWRLRLREARIALRSGRYDEASALLAAETLRDFLPAKKLARDVAEKILERAGERFAHGDSAAGWRDLTIAPIGLVVKLSDCTIEAAVCQRRPQRSASLPFRGTGCHGARAIGQDAPSRADRPARSVCYKIAQLMQEAENSSSRGHFAEASAAVTRAAALAGAEPAGNGTMDRNHPAFERRCRAPGKKRRRMSTLCHRRCTRR